jgi:hypothetical protein
VIKIVSATALDGFILRLAFDDGTEGDLDFGFAVSRATDLTLALRQPQFFARFFLELGALCWPNGLEFSAGSLQDKLKQAGTLRHTHSV